MSLGTRFSILIVEDDAIIATDLCRELQDYGFRVVGIASSYDEAIDLAVADPPKVACVDIRIKGSKDGIVLARTLREQGIRVVMITGNPDLLDSRDGSSCGRQAVPPAKRAGGEFARRSARMRSRCASWFAELRRLPVNRASAGAATTTAGDAAGPSPPWSRSRAP